MKGLTNLQKSKQMFGFKSPFMRKMKAFSLSVYSSLFHCWKQPLLLANKSWQLGLEPQTFLGLAAAWTRLFRCLLFQQWCSYCNFCVVFFCSCFYWKFSIMQISRLINIEYQLMLIHSVWKSAQNVPFEFSRQKMALDVLVDFLARKFKYFSFGRKRCSLRSQSSTMSTFWVIFRHCGDRNRNLTLL